MNDHMPLPHSKRLVSYLGTFGLGFSLGGLVKTIDLGIKYNQLSDLVRQDVITDGIQPHVLLSATGSWLIVSSLFTLLGVGMFGVAVNMYFENTKAEGRAAKRQ